MSGIGKTPDRAAEPVNRLPTSPLPGRKGGGAERWRAAAAGSTLAGIAAAAEPGMGKSEYLLVGGMIVLGAAALPLVKDVYMVQSIVLAVCGGLGFQ